MATLFSLCEPIVTDSISVGFLAGGGGGHKKTDHAVVFCGAVLQKPHHAVRQQISKLHSEVYVSAGVGSTTIAFFLHILLTNSSDIQGRGSPSYQYGLSPTNFITAVNGVPTPDLASFIKQVGTIPDNTYFRLRAVTFDNIAWVVTMKKNDHYVSVFFPPFLLPHLFLILYDPILLR